MINDTKARIYSLIKFGTEEHMSAFYKKGLLYLNTIEYFRLLEEEEYMRGDSYEGTTMVSNLRNVQVFVQDGDEERLLGEASHFHLRSFKEQIKGNLYCMYAIHPGVIKDREFKLDNRIADFGTHFVQLKAGVNETFCKKVFAALKKLNLNVFCASLVSYYDHEAEVYNTVDIFMKRKSFEFQNEFRFFVHQDLAQPLLLEIGSIEEIAEMGETKSLINRTFLTPE